MHAVIISIMMITQCFFVSKAEGWRRSSLDGVIHRIAFHNLRPSFAASRRLFKKQLEIEVSFDAIFRVRGGGDDQIDNKVADIEDDSSTQNPPLQAATQCKIIDESEESRVIIETTAIGKDKESQAVVLQELSSDDGAFNLKASRDETMEGEELVESKNIDDDKMEEDNTLVPALTTNSNYFEGGIQPQATKDDDSVDKGHVGGGEVATTLLTEGVVATDMDTEGDSLLLPTIAEMDDMLDIVRETASVLRMEGKDLHDSGNYSAAALKFSTAADLLKPHVLKFEDSSDDDNNGSDATEEFTMLRLHEALCCLKSEQFEAAVNAASAVIDLPTAPAAMRARAFHRRSKARLELNDHDEALRDARSAAFLGDRKAVALYGKLMRENSSGSGLSDPDSSSCSNNGAASSDLLESLLSKSGGSPFRSSVSETNSFLPTSLLSNMLGGTNSGNGGNLAKSVLTSLSKRIDDESTQDSICRFLKGTSGPQLFQLASMAGIPLQTEQADKISSMCHAVTPKLLKRLVTATKRTVYGVQLIRKTAQLISKYRNIILLWVLLWWIKSALLRPIPISKRAARRAAKAAMQAAAAAATATTATIATATTTTPISTSTDSPVIRKVELGGPFLLV